MPPSPQNRIKTALRAIETVPLRSVVPAASRSRPFPRVWLIPLCGSPSVTLRVNRTCPLIPLIPHVSLMCLIPHVTACVSSSHALIPYVSHHAQREWDRDLSLKMATTGMFRPAPGVPNKLGGLTEFTNDRMYMENLHWADTKEHTNKMVSRARASQPPYRLYRTATTCATPWAHHRLAI